MMADSLEPPKWLNIQSVSNQAELETL